MVSRENKRIALYEKLQLLRSVTNSHAVLGLMATPHELEMNLLWNKWSEGGVVFEICWYHECYRIFSELEESLNNTSIIIDASKYIQELKQKVEKINQDIATSQHSTAEPNPLPAQVTVETLEKGFLVNVFSDKSCPGLLVNILEAFEELGLNVLEARVSCTDSFQLEAVGGEAENVDGQVVEQAVLQAIRTWSESSEQE